MSISLIRGVKYIFRFFEGFLDYGDPLPPMASFLGTSKLDNLAPIDRSSYRASKYEASAA